MVIGFFLLSYLSATSRVEEQVEGRSASVEKCTLHSDEDCKTPVVQSRGLIQIGSLAMLKDDAASKGGASATSVPVAEQKLPKESTKEERKPAGQHRLNNEGRQAVEEAAKVVERELLLAHAEEERELPRQSGFQDVGVPEPSNGTKYVDTSMLEEASSQLNFNPRQAQPASSHVQGSNSISFIQVDSESTVGVTMCQTLLVCFCIAGCLILYQMRATMDSLDRLQPPVLKDKPSQVEVAPFLFQSTLRKHHEDTPDEIAGTTADDPSSEETGEESEDCKSEASAGLESATRAQVTIVS